MRTLNSMPFSINQAITLLIWAILTIYFINHGGRNNGIFRIVVTSGFRLILIGAAGAAIIGVNGTTENKAFTDAAIQFVLVLSAGVGGSYIAHANMALRDFPNKINGPETLPWQGEKGACKNHSINKSQRK